MRVDPHHYQGGVRPLQPGRVVQRGKPLVSRMISGVRSFRCSDAPQPKGASWSNGLHGPEEDFRWEFPKERLFSTELIHRWIFLCHSSQALTFPLECRWIFVSR